MENVQLQSLQKLLKKPPTIAQLSLTPLKILVPCEITDQREKVDKPLPLISGDTSNEHHAGGQGPRKRVG